MSQETASKPFFPPPLPKGGTVGLVSPCKWTRPEWIEALGMKVRERGYHFVVPEQNYLRQDQFAGDEATRAAAINGLFADPKIDAILCGRGGKGGLPLLEGLDYDLIRRNPKPFVGFSEITALLQAITGRTGMITYHGPLAVSFSPELYEKRNEEDLFAVIGAERKRISFPEAKTSRKGTARGRLVGGTLCLLQALVGTPFDWSGNEAVLFIEDVGEPYYKIERMMTHLRLAGKFKGLRAALIAEIVDADTVEPPEVPYGKTLEEIMLAHLPPDIPVAFNAPCGHGRYISTFPVGADVTLELSEEGGVLSF